MQTPIKGFFTTSLLLIMFISGYYSHGYGLSILWVLFVLVAFVWVIALGCVIADTYE